MSNHSPDLELPLPVSPDRPRLFLSYGRRDAAALANRLRADLEAWGFEVWQDSNQIRTGKEWEEEIREGLRSVQVVVALLSPHAVRRNLDPNSSDNIDSVCLDEISFARFAHPPKPILPVMAVSCEPPFSIFRLDYTDMTRWSQSEDQYRIGLERIVQGLEAALRGEPPAYRRWHHRLPSIDFSAFLHEKRQYFVGRQWLFNRIDVWRTTSGQERALLITGDPGAGKSAFVAEMVHRNSESQVLAYHCCMADDRQTLEPGTFVQSIAAMIASRLPDYADQLEDPLLEKILSTSEAASNPGRALDQGVLVPLERISAPIEGVRLILIDALDEAIMTGDVYDNIVTLLAPRLERLPSWIRVVATTRKEREVLDRLGSLRVASIDAQAANNLIDIDMFIEARLDTPDLAERLATSRLSVVEVQRRLRAAGNGNFLYAKIALQDIERDHYSFSRIEELPRGLSGIYRSFFDRQFSGQAEGYHKARAVLEVIVAAQEPLTFDLLEHASGLDGDYSLPLVLEVLSVFVPEQDGKYAVYHRSLADWLTDVNCAYRASARRGNERLARAFLRYLDATRVNGSTADSRNNEAVLDYWSKHGFDHLSYCNVTLPQDLIPESLESVISTVREGSPALGTWTEQVPRFARGYVENLIRASRYGDLLQLVQALKRLAMLEYMKSGIIEGLEIIDGKQVYRIGGRLRTLTL